MFDQYSKDRGLHERDLDGRTSNANERVPLVEIGGSHEIAGSGGAISSRT